MPRNPRAIEFNGYRASVLRAAKRGGWTWRVVKQGRASAYVGTLTGSRDDALAELIRLVQAGTIGEPRAAGESAKTASLTVRDVLTRWLAAQAERTAKDYAERERVGDTVIAEKTRKQYERSVGVVNRSPLADVRQDRLQLLDVEAFVTARLRTDEAARATLRQEIIALSAAFRFGAARGWATAVSFKWPNIVVPHTEKELPTDDEIRAMLAEMPAEWMGVALLVVGLGLRAQEACLVTRGDLTADCSSVFVRFGKGAKTRRVSVAPEMAQAFSAWLVEHPGLPAAALFPTRHVDQRRQLSYIFEDACEQAQVPFYGLHRFRHAFATRFVRAGVTAEVAAKLLGNCAEVLRQHYRQVQASDLAAGAASAGFDLRRK